MQFLLSSEHQNLEISTMTPNSSSLGNDDLRRRSRALNRSSPFNLLIFETFADCGIHLSQRYEDEVQRITVY